MPGSSAGGSVAGSIPGRVLTKYVKNMKNKKIIKIRYTLHVPVNSLDWEHDYVKGSTDQPASETLLDVSRATNTNLRDLFHIRHKISTIYVLVIVEM